MKIVENIIIRDTAGDSADVTAAGALKVDGSAVAQPVTDNGASLTVDAVSLPLPTGAATETTLDAIKTAIETLDNAISGTEIQADIVAPLPAGTNTIGAVKITDGVDETDVLNLANSNPLVVAIVDTNGDQIASFGGGTQYPEGTVDATATGTLALMEAAGDTMVPVQGTVADGLLVNLGSNNDVTVTGSVTANAGTDLNTSALALEATLQSVKTAVEIIDNIVSGSEAQVDIVAPLPSGTNNIGDVDILSVPAPLNVVGSGLEATALRVTIATDSTGVVSIDDNGSSITVDGTVSVSGSVAVTGPLTDTELRATPVPISGTVTANAGTNLNTSALALETTATSIKNAVEVIDNAIAGTEMQVDVVAPLPAGTNNIGDVDVLSLPSIPAGTNNIGDVDIASIATGDNAIGRVKLTDGTDVADILDLTNSNSLAVAIVDGTGNQITSFGGGQQYTEGATDATITGTAMMMEGAGDTLLPVQGTVADGLLVNLGGNNDVTVTGSVTANAGTNLNTSALALETTASAIKTAVEIIDNAIAGTEMQVDIVSMPPVTATDLDIRNLTATDVVTAELSAVDNAVLDAIAASVAAIDTDTSTIIGHVDGLETLIGTTNTNTGNSATALQLIDDTVATLGTDTYTEAATKGLVIGAVRRDADTTLVDTTNEISPLQVDANGRLKVEAFSGETLPVSLASTTVTGTVAVTQSGTWDEVGINDSGNSITVDDGGVSLTVDGSVSITGAVDTELPAAAALADDTANPTLPSVGTFPHWYDGATWDRAKGDATDGLLVNLGANNDITGTVTANAGTNLNTSALALETTASAIKTAVELLDDAVSGTELQVDIVAALPAGTNNIGDVDVLSIAAGTNYIGKVRLTDGTLDSNIVDETGASAVDALAVGGGTPHDSVDSGNPVKVGFKAINALPTAVATDDRANGISDLWGRQLVSHIDPAMQITKAVNVTSTQTGTDVWDPAASAKIAITSVVIASYGTTAGRVILWFGDNADTTYTAGTDQVLLVASFAPSATTKPGLVFTPSVPIFCTTANRELHLTTDAAMSLDITVHGYEFL